MNSFLKTLLIILLVYFGLKFLIRLLTPYILKYISKKVGQKFGQFFDDPSQFNAPKSKEGDVTIESLRRTPSNRKKKVGEYVDYEELE